MFDPTPNLDIVDKLIRIFGIPGIIGVVVWLIRTYDNGQRTIKAIDERTQLTEQAITSVQACVTTIQTNHLEHLAEAITGIAATQADTLKVLGTMDKTLAILSDRSTRGMVVETTIRHADDTSTSTL
jgi:hypothetical protein